MLSSHFEVSENIFYIYKNILLEVWCFLLILFCYVVEFYRRWIEPEPNLIGEEPQLFLKSFKYLIISWGAWTLLAMLV